MNRKQRIAHDLVLDRDNHCCQDCGRYTCEVHHVTGRRHRWAWDVRNLITLCPVCHRLKNKGAGAHGKQARLRHLKHLQANYGYEYTEPPFIAALGVQE